jgi:Sap, sulfolipid-1-addressing protein
MGSLLADLLPLAVGIAVSPVPVIAAILMLLAPRARQASVAFGVGWVAGVALVTAVAALLARSATAADDHGSSDLVAWIRLVLGAGLLALAWRLWSHRPRPGDEPEIPGWMKAVDTVTPVRALGLGAALAGLNPKNLLLCLAAGASIGQAASAGVAVLVPTVVFVVLASLSVAGPVVAYLVAADRLHRPLSELQSWLQANNAAVMGVLLLVLGVSLVGKGLGQLIGA